MSDDAGTTSRIIREALAAINVQQQEQELKFKCYCLSIDAVNAHPIANFLQDHPRAVSKLVFRCFRFQFTTEEALHILRVTLAEANLQVIRLQGFIGNEIGAKILSSLHCNLSVKELLLLEVGLEGVTNKMAITTLIQYNSRLKKLDFGYNPFGIDGARAIQAGLGANVMLETLYLNHCQLGDEGLSLIVDALLERNSTITDLGFDGNRITANGLPRITRLLEKESLSLQAIVLDKNPGLFDNEENTRRFSTVLSQSPTMTQICMNLCQSPASAVIAVFQASVVNKKLLHLGVYDHDQLQGQDKDYARLLAIIPTVNLLSLYINVDFDTEPIISSFHRNMTIRHLLFGVHAEAITAGPVFGSLERNRLLRTVVRRAVEAINVDEKEQELKIKCNDVVIDEVNARHIAGFLQQHPHAVEKFEFRFRQFTTQAVEIFRAYLTEASLQFMYLNGNLGNDKGRRLLSGLHGNTSITQLELGVIGIDGANGGTIMSELIQSNSTLTKIHGGLDHLGLAGAQMLQMGIRGNRTLLELGLPGCRFGDEGLSVIVDAVQGNNTIEQLYIYSNGITANGLPHVTRLLQNAWIVGIDIAYNPGMFDNEDNVRLFAGALRYTSKLKWLRLNLCQMSGNAFTTLFQAAANNKKLKELYMYDRVRLDGLHLERLIETIAQMRNLLCLHVNLDFTNESVVSSLHRNTSIVLLYGGMERIEYHITGNSRVAGILSRNNRIYMANLLLNSEPQRMIPLGLWACGLAIITGDNTGATAAYKILQEKLVMWWAPPPSGLASAAPPPVLPGPRPIPSHDADANSSAAVAAASVPSLSTSTATGLITQGETTGNDMDASSTRASGATTTKSTEKRSKQETPIGDSGDVEASTTDNDESPLKKRARR